MKNTKVVRIAAAIIVFASITARPPLASATECTVGVCPVGALPPGKGEPPRTLCDWLKPHVWVNCNGYGGDPWTSVEVSTACKPQYTMTIETSVDDGTLLKCQNECNKKALAKPYSICPGPGFNNCITTSDCFLSCIGHESNIYTTILNGLGQTLAELIRELAGANGEGLVCEAACAAE